MVRVMVCGFMLGACQPASDRTYTQRGNASTHIAKSGEPVFIRGKVLGNRPAILLAAFDASRGHNRDPADYHTKALTEALAAAQSGNSAARQRADELLSRAYLNWARDLATPRGIISIDTDAEAANPAFDARTTLRAAAEAPDLAEHLTVLQARHPIYSALVAAMREALAANRETLVADREALAADRDLPVIAANLERARLLPALPKGKHIVVDAASARLFMFDGHRKIGTMKTVIGRTQMPTPMMTGMMRYVVTQPYWNLPADIVRNSIAPEVLRSGVDQLRSRDLEILSDWSDSATIVDPGAINWQAVAHGERTLRVRQRPGPGNMMGQIKFMLPNELGIYLHDTPKRQDFASRRRAQSAGCVRVEDAARLAMWVFDGANPIARSGTDRIADLPTPVPVYINYFTLVPTPRGLARNFDIYRRDAPMISAARTSQVTRGTTS